MRAERRFRAMGSDVHVVVIGHARLLEAACARVHDLEARWTRFRLDSEVSRLNQANGEPTIVSADTALLVARAVEAWRATRGAFDPTVYDAMLELGYDRDFGLLSTAGGAPLERPAPGLDGVIVDLATRLVRLPPGVHLDPGGIGKGLAADLVVGELLDRGAAGACVSVGGDVRVAGAPDDRPGWSISIADPIDASRELTRIDLDDGAVATSSTQRRTWWRAGMRLHHVVDPRTGLPAQTRRIAATVVGREAWWAEVRATEALLAADPLAPTDVEILVVDEHGDVRATSAFEEVLACSRP